jgi:hypothetical protein
MANLKPDNSVDSLETLQFPAPEPVSDSACATIGTDAAARLAEIEATNAPPDALRRLCISVGCVGAVLVLGWGIIESNLLIKRTFESTVVFVLDFQMSQEACRLSNGKNSWWPDRASQGNLWLNNSGWCSGLTPEAKANLSRWYQ